MKKTRRARKQECPPVKPKPNSKAETDVFLEEVEKILDGVRPELRNSKKTGREMIDELYDEDGLPR